MVITDIERQKKNQRRYNIYIDGEFALGVDRNVIVDNGLRKGDKVNRTFLDRLRNADEQVRAYQIAMRFLSYRPRSEHEVRKRMEREEFLTATIDQLVEKLRAENQLDDRRFADIYAESKMLNKPIGARRLRHELQQKGISDTIIRSIEHKYCGDENETENARRLARKKLSSDKSHDVTGKKRRLSDHLARRGYDWEIIRNILREFFNE